MDQYEIPSTIFSKYTAPNFMEIHWLVSKMKYLDRQIDKHDNALPIIMHSM